MITYHHVVFLRPLTTKSNNHREHAWMLSLPSHLQQLLDVHVAFPTLRVDSFWAQSRYCTSVMPGLPHWSKALSCRTLFVPFLPSSSPQNKSSAFRSGILWLSFETLAVFAKCISMLPWSLFSWYSVDEQRGENFYSNFEIPQIPAKSFQRVFWSETWCAQMFFTTPMPKSEGVTQKKLNLWFKIRDFGANNPSSGAKNQIFGAKSHQCGAKFIYHRQNSNSINFCTTNNLQFGTRKTPNPTDLTPPHMGDGKWKALFERAQIKEICEKTGKLRSIRIMSVRSIRIMSVGHLSCRAQGCSTRRRDAALPRARSSARRRCDLRRSWVPCSPFCCVQHNVAGWRLASPHHKLMVGAFQKPPPSTCGGGLRKVSASRSGAPSMAQVQISISTFV